MSSEHQNGNVADNKTRKEQAKIRTEQAETRTEQAGTKTEQDKTRREQTRTHADQDKTRTEQAETQTEQDETRIDQYRTQSEQIASKLLAAIIESSDDAIISKTLDGIITSWNRGAEKLFEYSAQECVGKSMLMLFPPERVAEESEILARIRHGGGVDHFETVRVAKSGKLIDVSVTLSPIRNHRDEIIGASKIARDITGRKRAEAMGRESEERFRTMANSIPQLAWIARADGFIHWYNQRWYEYTGTSPEQMEGWGWQSVHDPQRLQDVMAQWTGAIAAGQPFEMEFPLRGADGNFRRFLTRAHPFKNAAGRVEQWFGTNTDVDELKRAEHEVKTLNAELEQRVVRRTAELVAANQELEAFSYTISHDLRAPLRAVSGFAAIVLEDFGPQLPAEGKRYLERIRKGGQQMGELIDDLLAFSRLGRHPVNRNTVDIATIVHHVLDELKPLVDGRLIDIRIGELPFCYGDPVLLKQVWVNLLSNAIKYTRDQKPAVVTVGCTHENGVDVYFVRDNGAGFDMQYADKLFGVFQRLHRTDEFEGTGVGLAIVQRIVHRHGGRVWAEAKIGHGATFYFTLEREIKI